MAHAVLLVFGMVDAQRLQTGLARLCTAGDGGNDDGVRDTEAGPSASALVALTESFFDGIVQSHVRHFKIPFNLCV